MPSTQCELYRFRAARSVREVDSVYRDALSYLLRCLKAVSFAQILKAWSRNRWLMEAWSSRVWCPASGRVGEGMASSATRFNSVATRLHQEGGSR